MKNIHAPGVSCLEALRGGTGEWYWATDAFLGDLYEAEERFRQGEQIQSNRVYLIHYPDGAVYEPIPPAAGQYLGDPVYENGAIALLLVNFLEGTIRILLFRDGDRLYFTLWHEDPDYWEEIVVRSLPDGAILEKFPGSIHTMPNGERWLLR